MSDGMELGFRIRAIKRASNHSPGAEPFSVRITADVLMIPEPHEPFDSNRKEDTIFLLGSMFIVIFLFLL